MEETKRSLYVHADVILALFIPEEVEEHFEKDVDKFLDKFCSGDLTEVKVPERILKAYYRSTIPHYGDCYGSYSGKELSFEEWVDDLTVTEIEDDRILEWIDSIYPLTPSNTECEDLVDDFIKWRKKIDNDTRLVGFLFKHSDGTVGAWGVDISEEDEEKISEILQKYEADGVSIRGKANEITISEVL